MNWISVFLLAHWVVLASAAGVGCAESVVNSEDESGADSDSDSDGDADSDGDSDTDADADTDILTGKRSMRSPTGRS